MIIPAAAREPCRATPDGLLTPPARHPWPALAVVFLLAVLPYLNTLRNGFVLDDTVVIRDNPLIRGLDGIPRLFRENYWAPRCRSNLYRPLTMASYAVNRALLGPEPWAYHAVNVLLHGAASVALLLLARGLVADPRAALAASSLFAVHPLHAEAVAGVVGRAELLAALFPLGALVLHRRASKASRWNYLAAAALLSAGFYCKEVALGALLAFAVHDLTRWRGGLVVHRWPYLLYAAGVMAYLLSRHAVLGAEELVGPSSLARLDNVLAGEGAGPRILTAASVIMRYLFLVVWPATLSADYSHAQIDVVRSPADLLALGGLAVLGGALIALVIASARGRRDVAVALALFLGTYFVVSNLAVLIGALMAERFFYLPSAGLALLLAALAARLGRRLGDRGFTLALVLLVLVLAGRTWVRNDDFRDELTLFRKTVGTSPRSVRAHAYLGRALRSSGDLDGALQAMDRAIRIDPDEAWSWNELGMVHGSADTERAEKALRTALARMPRFAQAHYNLAWVYLWTGRFEEAIPELKTALAQRPHYPEARISLARTYLELGLVREARPEIEAALRSNPESSPAQHTLGMLLEAEGKLGEAASAYARAREIDPRHAQASFDLGRLLEHEGRVEAAVLAYLRAADGEEPPLETFTRAAMLLAGFGRLDEAARALERGRTRLGSSATLENNAGTLALLRGDREGARRAWRRSLELDPGNTFARGRLQALEAEGRP